MTLLMTPRAAMSAMAAEDFRAVASLGLLVTFHLGSPFTLPSLLPLLPLLLFLPLPLPLQ